MSDLTYNEGIIMACVRNLFSRHLATAVRSKTGACVAAIPAIDVRREAARYNVRYDSTQHALAGCVEKGFLTKPKRGWYALAGDER